MAHTHHNWVLVTHPNGHQEIDNHTGISRDDAMKNARAFHKGAKVISIPKETAANIAAKTNPHYGDVIRAMPNNGKLGE